MVDLLSLAQHNKQMTSRYQYKDVKYCNGNGETHGNVEISLAASFVAAVVAVIVVVVVIRGAISIVAIVLAQGAIGIIIAAISFVWLPPLLPSALRGEAFVLAQLHLNGALGQCLCGSRGGTG